MAEKSAETVSSPSRDAAAGRAPWRGRWRLRSYLMALVIVVCAPFIAFQAYYIASESRALHQQAATVSYHAARAIAGEVTQFVRSTDRALAFLANRPQVRALDPANCDPMIKILQAARDSIANVLTVDLEGRLICSAAGVDPARRQQVDPKYWLARLRETEQPVIGAPARGFVTGLWVVTMAYPVRDDSGKMVGAAAMAMDLARFQFSKEGLRAPEDTTIAILNGEGVIIARSADAETWLGKNVADHATVRAALAQRSGTLRSAGLDGVERDLGFTPVAGTDWVVTAGIPTSIAKAQVASSVFSLTVIAAVALALALLLAWRIARRVSVPVREMAAAAQRVAAGDDSARAPVAGPDEIAEVALQFNNMLSAQRLQQEVLRQSEEKQRLALRDATESEARYRSYFDSSMDAQLLTAPDGSIVDLNAAACEMFGRSAEEIRRLGRNVVVDVADPRLHAALKERARTGRVRAQITMVRANGTKFPVEIVSTVFTDAAGLQKTTMSVRDITERMRAEEEIRALNADLERRVAERTEQLVYANRAKDSFLAAMSHEVRTPLGGLLEMLELLALSPVDTEQREPLRAAITSGQSLARIVDDILDWSKIEAGKLALSPEPTLIAEIVTGVANTYARIASAKGLRLRQHVDPGLSPALVADALRLSQVLNNFVSNAIKFSKVGEVEIRAELLGKDDGAERVRFSVRDMGIGMDKALQERLFQSYFQGSAATARMYGGTGLGLAICRRLADLMNAQIDVQSAPGKGSVFNLTLTLPVAAHAPESAPGAHETAAATEPLVPASAAARAPLVLVVDDHPTNRELLARQVKLLGLRAETADDGVRALRMWREGSFDMVITDCHMPGLDGYELTRAIRELEASKSRRRSPVIAWTANVLAEEAERCRDAGMDDLLTKPTGLARLRATLEKWLPAIEKRATNEPGAEARTPGQDTEPPIDFAQLAEVATDRAEHLEILRGFQAHNASELRELKQALAAGDLMAAAQSAHRLKGASRLVGARQIAAACAAIEAAARRGDADAALASGALLDPAAHRFDDELAAQAHARGNS